jgi:hypothetical protein
LLAEGQGSKAKDRAYGRKWFAWSMQFNRGSYSLRTHRQLPLAGFLSSWPACPPWGLMRDGVCWAHQPLVHRTFVLGGFALLLAPTLRAADAEEGAYQMQGGKDYLTLVGYVRLLPTLQERDYKGEPGDGSSSRGGRKASLPRAAALLPTLTAGDFKRGPDTRSGKRGNGRNLPTELGQGLAPTLVASDWRPGCSTLKDDTTRPLRDRLKTSGGALNPKWTEWFMGWPIGATELPPKETGKYRFKSL